MTINRIESWSDEAFESVANTFVREHSNIRNEFVEPIDKHIVHVHRSAQLYSNQMNEKLHRLNVLTLRSLMNFINTYLKLIGTYAFIYIYIIINYFLYEFGIISIFPFISLDDKFVEIVEKCTHFADAIARIDEGIEQIELLNISVIQQRSRLSSMGIICEEICARIEIGTIVN